MRYMILIAMLAMAGCDPITLPTKPSTPDTPVTPLPVGDAIGYRIRLKTYNPPHKQRLFSAKIDTRFHTELGVTAENATLTVDGIELPFYGVDAENGKHDLSFCDKARHHKDLPKPVVLKIFKDGELVAEVEIPEWKYGAVYVKATKEDV